MGKYFFTWIFLIGCANDGAHKSPAGQESPNKINSDDFVGIYEIVTYKGNENSCDGPLSDLEQHKYLRFEVAPYRNGMDIAFCKDSECKHNIIDPQLFFPEKLDGKWQGDGIWGSGDFSSGCSLDYVANTAILGQNSHLEVESRRYTGTVQMEGSDKCAPDRVKELKYRSQLKCRKIKKITATR